jgi:hypothetical protein
MERSHHGRPTVLRAFSQRLLAAGEPKIIAFIAVARKILTILNAIVRGRRPDKPLTDKTWLMILLPSGDLSLGKTSEEFALLQAPPRPIDGIKCGKA